ncbi:hypothetical protein ACA910_020440 [Epithemia clementina (nom. ined.)]
MGDIEITEEQRERMRRNRERALEIQKRKRQESERNNGTEVDEKVEESTLKKQKSSVDESSAAGRVEENDVDVELEDFEVGAPPFVTKNEAMKMYLLPEGTLAVCKYTEKQNPRHRGWTAMKLYDRVEIRRRARERWGGIRGLEKERQRREEKRFQNDLEKTKNIFDTPS